MQSRRTPLLFLLVSLVGTLARAAHADPSAAASATEGFSESDRLIEQGLRLREEGRDAEALSLFERARELQPTPRADAQLALANQALGNWVAAERGLMAALGATGNPWVAQRAAILQKALATVREQLAWLEVETNLPGAEVSVNDKALGSTPLAGALRVPAGLVHLKVTAAGYAPVLRLVHVTAGERAHEALVLEPDPGVRPRPEEGRRAAAPAPPGVAPDEENGASPPRSATRTLAWVALGGGVALVAGGAAATAVRESSVATWNDEAACLKGTATRAQTCSQYQSTANTATVLAAAGYATGGALALTSLILFLRAPRAPPPLAQAFAPRCGVGVLAVSCEGTF